MIYTPEQAEELVGHLHRLIAADISHPHIAAPIAAGLEESAAYLAQEYAVGDSLDVVLRERGPLSIDEAVPLVESLVAAIDHARSRGVHHGSLHPRDIILSADGARITGFGIAAALSRVGAKLPTRPQYSAPDGSSDAYALGAIAFEMVTGKRVTPANLEDFKTTHRAELRGAFWRRAGSAHRTHLRAGDPVATWQRRAARRSRQRSAAHLRAGRPGRDGRQAAPSAGSLAPSHRRPIASVGKADFDLRIDQPVRSDSSARGRSG